MQWFQISWFPLSTILSSSAKTPLAIKKKKKATKFWRENSNIKQANNIALTYGEAYIQ